MVIGQTIPFQDLIAPADKSMRSLLLTLLAIGTIDAVADTWSPYTDEPMTTGAPSDLIFDNGFDGQQNGGTSCATAIILGGGSTYTGDTTAAPNWMSTFGPLFSPSNDVVYKFVAGPDVDGFITPTGSNFTFAMYLIPSCAESGSEPSPIGATATVGRGIDLLASGVTSGNTYYLAITGTASGGGGANGTLNFTTPFSIAIPPKF
jgi:hypothetical protein